MKVSIIIPNWNGKHLLSKNLDSVIEAKANKKNNILEIIVVDDASTDGSVLYIEENFSKQVRLIKHKKNLGFAQAVNTGARHSKGELICLLNTDVIPDKNFLSYTSKLFEEKNVFAVGLHERSFGPAIANFSNGYLAHKSGPESTSVQISFWASGGSAVFRRDLWWKLGGFDYELFEPFYWEDVDLGYRAWKRGYKILWDPNAHVLHKHEGTINQSAFQKIKTDRIKERNELLFIWKNITSRSLINKHIASVLARCISHPGYVRIVLMALSRHSVLSKKRAKESTESSVSDEAIFTQFS